jgi:hypothetical protein
MTTASIKCIVCAKRTTEIQDAFTCINCTNFLVANGYTYNSERIETYIAIVSGILARTENSKFLAEIMSRKQEQKQSVLDAIHNAIKVGA